MQQINEQNSITLGSIELNMLGTESVTLFHWEWDSGSNCLCILTYKNPRGGSSFLARQNCRPLF